MERARERTNGEEGRESYFTLLVAPQSSAYSLYDLGLLDASGSPDEDQAALMPQPQEDRTTVRLHETCKAPISHKPRQNKISWPQQGD